MKPSLQYHHLFHLALCLPIPVLVAVYWALGMLPFSFPASLISFGAAAVYTATVELLDARRVRRYGDEGIQALLARRPTPGWFLRPIAVVVVVGGLALFALWGAMMPRDGYAFSWLMAGFWAGRLAGYPHRRAVWRKLQEAAAAKNERLSGLLGPPDASVQS